MIIIGLILKNLWKSNINLIKQRQFSEKTKEKTTDCTSYKNGEEPMTNDDVMAQDVGSTTPSSTPATSASSSDSTHPSSTEYPHMKKRKLVMRMKSAAAEEPAAKEDTTTTVKQGPPNDIEKFLSLRKQVRTFLDHHHKKAKS